jgi:hypothetical protein
MMEVFEKYDAPVIATMQIEGEAISRFGVIDAQEVEPNVYRIRDMVRNPHLPRHHRTLRSSVDISSHRTSSRPSSARLQVRERDTNNGCYAAATKR